MSNHKISRPFSAIRIALPFLALFGLISCANAQSVLRPVGGVVFDAKADTRSRWIPSSAQVTFEPGSGASAQGIAVAMESGTEGYPGIRFQPPGAAWDLSAFGHVDARITNTGTAPLSLSLRVDNAGDWRDNPWDTETVSIAPGATETVRVIFGYSYGLKPGYRLKPAAVSGLLFFTGKLDTAHSFRIESIVAGGTAGEQPFVSPEDVRAQPKAGVILGAGTTIDVAQLAPQNGRADLVSEAGVQSVRLTVPASQSDAAVSIKPAQGRWDLRAFSEARIRVRNRGKAPVTPRVRIDSNGGSSDWTTAASPLPPGKESVLVVPFAGAATHDIGQPDTLNKMTSDAVSAITIGTTTSGEEQRLQISAIHAASPPAQTPEWLGKRPPVAGKWVKTFDDEFNGSAIDASLWNIQGENYYDQQSHWSKENVLVGNGVARIRYARKTGFQNDDPAKKQTPYASGYLDTYDKWKQRYGYFEARMKLPTAPGLWPAFWMMPDRGDRADPRWKRQDTANGGMEFDIVEHLTRWGSHRYNIAMHWDGYDKNHKSLGSDKNYVQPDKDGYITAGLLWTPGQVIYYCNGKEVLRWSNARISNVPEMMMFTLPMGGWDNSPLDDARLPDDLVIDYVRVWQRADLASKADGKMAPEKR